MYIYDIMSLLMEVFMEKEEKKICSCDDHCSDNCSCGDDCNCHDSEPIIVEMEDVNGEKVKVEVIATFEDNGKNYAIVNDLDNTDNSYIFEIQSAEEGDILTSIDDEEEFERLCKVIEELTK